MTVSQLANLLGLEYQGQDKTITAINTIKDATASQMTYLENAKYLDAIKTTSAGVVIISKEFVNALPEGTSALMSDNPHLSMAYASKHFAKALIVSEGEDATVDATALIQPRVYLGKNTSIGANTVIMAGAYIGDNVSIGEGCIIHPNAVIYNDTVIGNRCHILANSVIGSDGFGYAHTKMGEHIKIYHNGNVVLEDDVEVGAGSTIDRAVFASTIIRAGTKIDNLVQIGHNCDLGVGCIIVSQVGISGSTTLGRNVVMGGQSATSGHLKIGDFATIAARGGVSKSLEGGKVYGGFPILLQKDWLRLQARILKYFKQK